MMGCGWAWGFKDYSGGGVEVEWLGWGKLHNQLVVTSASFRPHFETHRHTHIHVSAGQRWQEHEGSHPEEPSGQGSHAGTAQEGQAVAQATAAELEFQ
eukprot:14598166-Alexandrium_andersonii.AAC.1